MPLLVDCYNVLHAPMPSVLAGLDEAGLCRVLGRSVWAPDRIWVVCDGGVKPQGPGLSPVKGVQLVYTGRGRSADDWIIARIQADHAPRRLTIASNDRQIQIAGRRRRCRVVGCGEFIHSLVAGAIGAAGGGDCGYAEGRLHGPLGQQEVRQWLERFGIDWDDT